MIKYPKIETLYNRRPDTFKVITDELRLPEFGLIKAWLITEKVDGTNVRVHLSPDGQVALAGRTDRAQLHPKLMAYLTSTFTTERFERAIDRAEDGTLPNVTLFGEGYGPKIQSGGKYRSDQSFILFDVMIEDWWLNWPDVQKIAKEMEIDTVPFVTDCLLLPASRDDLDGMLICRSLVAYANTGNVIQAEGVVARTDPLLNLRNGGRLMWKLKYRDFGD